MPTIDQSFVHDLMVVLTDHRLEAYPLEKPIALLTLVTWILWPNNPDLVELSTLVAASRAIMDIEQEKSWLGLDRAKSDAIDQIWCSVFKPQEVAKNLLAMKPIFRFSETIRDEFWFLDGIYMIVDFLIRYSPDKPDVGLRPSLNKALFFILPIHDRQAGIMTIAR